MDPVFKALNDAYIFNLSLELAIVYNLPRFVDSKQNTDLTSHILRSNVLYFETNKQRFELASFTSAEFAHTYRLSKVEEPQFKDDDFFYQ